MRGHSSMNEFVSAISTENKKVSWLSQIKCFQSSVKGA